MSRSEHRAQTRSTKTGPLATLFAPLCGLAGVFALLALTAAPALAAQPPLPTIESPTAVTFHSAHLAGNVNPEGEAGSGPTTWSFELSSDGGADWAPLAGHEILAPASEEANSVALEEEATGLQPNTAYLVRLSATNQGGGPIASAEEPFTTQAIAPTATTLPFVGPASAEAARIYASVNPHNSPTTYFFEYGPADCASNPCTSIPLTEDAAVGSGNATETVGQDLSGLQPTTTYHYRIVAHNAAGTVAGADQTLTTAAAPPAACPNEQLRSEDSSTTLPDCRAYEQVSPSFKSGGREAIEAISSDGSRLIIDSTSVFAGADGYAELADAIYESARTPSGWSTAALNPPSSLYPAQRFIDANPDLGRSLWGLRRRSQSLKTEDLYRREANGSLVEIGPMWPPYATEGPPGGEFSIFALEPHPEYAGDSADLSHTFFQLEGFASLWPGDTTQGQGARRSLYEYIGTGNAEPQLVGVSDGHTVVNGETLPAGRLISDCGTSLGSYRPPSNFNANTHDSISADGETVFFTPLAIGEQRCSDPNAPAVNELYARLGQGTASQTVPISEPTAADCEECQTAIRANAEFAGASADGSLAFFTTAQELLPGDRGKNLYAYDFNGPEGHKILPISTSSGVEEPGVQGVVAFSEDGAHVYFSATGVLTEGANAEGKSPTQGESNLYLYQRDAAHPAGQLTFVASGGVGAAQATPDGRYLAFLSAADLTPGDTSSVTQVFEYDALREELIRVSVGELGCEACRQSADANETAIVTPEYRLSATVLKSMRGVALSDDGLTVAFIGAGLTRSTLPAAEAGQFSVYRYRSHGALADGHLAAISTGNPSFGTFGAETTHSGRDVFFRTEEPILATDGDTQRDVYDAHEGGGFPAPSSTPICEGEGCQGTPASTPPKAAPVTPGFHGPGNEPEKPKCKQHFVRKHDKCVKRHAKKNHKSKHQRANTNRRAGR